MIGEPAAYVPHALMERPKELHVLLLAEASNALGDWAVGGVSSTNVLAKKTYFLCVVPPGRPAGPADSSLPCHSFFSRSFIFDLL